MKPMYPDTASMHFCPFALPDKQNYPVFYCIGDECLAWEEVVSNGPDSIPPDIGMGICTRLSRRRVIQSLSSRALEVVMVDLIGDHAPEEAF